MHNWQFLLSIRFEETKYIGLERVIWALFLSERKWNTKKKKKNFKALKINFSKLRLSKDGNPILGFSNSGSFWLVLLSSQLLRWYNSVSYCLFPLLIALTIPHSFHNIPRDPYVTPKLFALFSIWFFFINISYTIHLLINSFLIWDKHSVDLILIHLLLISLQLCCFCMESLFQLSITVFIPFFFMLYFLSSSWYFSFLLISPLWWHSKMFMCFVTSFIVF